MINISQLSDEYIDLLLYVLTGIGPDSKVCDLGAATKGECRLACRSQYIVKLQRQPNRLALLSEEFDNLPLVAIRFGLNPDVLSPGLRNCYEHYKAKHMLASQVGRSAELAHGHGQQMALGNGEAALEDSAAPKPLAGESPCGSKPSAVPTGAGVEAAKTEQAGGEGQTVNAEMAPGAVTMILPRLTLPRGFAARPTRRMSGERPTPDAKRQKGETVASESPAPQTPARALEPAPVDLTDDSSGAVGVEAVVPSTDSFFPPMPAGIEPAMQDLLEGLQRRFNSA